MPAKKTAATPPRTRKADVPKRRFLTIFRRPFQRLRDLRTRRPHKSLKLTRRRDKPHRVRLPGYIAFTISVFKTLNGYRRPLLMVLVLYVLVALLLIGVTQQDQLRSITDVIEQVNQEVSGNPLDTATKAVALFGSTLIGSLNTSLSEIQQFYMAIVYALMWLVLVWLLRHLMAENAVRVRDALYNAGAPIISTICIVSLMLLQALPGAVGAFVFSLSIQDGILSGGVAAMCFGVLAILLLVLSLYWLTSSFIALIIVTIPGTYPMSAIRGAAELVLGRRMQVLFRLLWLCVLLVLVWAVVLIPAILIDLWVKLPWLPLVTIMVQVASGSSIIIGVSYIYMLYRRMVDEPTQ